MLTAKQALNKAFLRLKPERAEIARFKAEFARLLDALLCNPGESEEFGKNLLSDFLKNAYYAPDYFINTSGRIDLTIHTGKDSASPVGVIIETKKAGSAAEMPSRENLNAKALQQALWYYLRERIKYHNIEIKRLIVTDCREWFIFDAADFERLFFADKALVKTYQDFADGALLGRDTAFFYANIAQPVIEKYKDALPYTYFSAADYEAFLRSGTAEHDAQLIAPYKLLSPTHLLKLPFANDSNSLDRAFYAELLYLLGLTETERDHKKVIVRNPPAARQEGSLLENALFHLASRLPLAGEDELFSAALELVITWINRVLFLKLLESQLLAYQNGNAEHAFLSADKIPTYNALDALFFHALAVEADKRDGSVARAFKNVPYLNSSLFEMSETELQYFPIGQLAERDLALFSSTVLKDSSGRKRTGAMNALGYLFAFLDAYDFASEGTEAIQEERKTLVNASVLGLIFEKINGYQDGSYFTPGSVTAYMCRETITRSALDKFNAAKGWDARTLTDLHNRTGRSAAELAEANAILDSIRVCDPAVGSGHFLVSVLNELIALKSELGVLMDADGRLLKGYRAEAANDELVLSSEEDGAIFSYNPQGAESRRVQETLFREKRRIIETQLFGVDVNPNSVKICRLRLWIELLKNAYYTKESGYAALETLPNIDINIKCGNSLVSRFACDADVKRALADTEYTVQGYKDAVQAYRNTRSKREKAGLERVIADIKARFRQEVEHSDPLARRKQRLEAELSALTKQGALFEPTRKEAQETAARVAELSARIAETEAGIAELRSGKIYENAFEWRFEFPEALSDEGDFIGFDIVIGNPPYVESRSSDVPKELKLEYQKQVVRDFNKNAEYITLGADLLVYFYPRASKILSHDGIGCLIVENAWLNTDYGMKASCFFTRTMDYMKIVDSSFRHFDSAKVNINTVITFFKNNSKIKTVDFSFMEKSDIDISDKIIKQYQSDDNFLSKMKWGIILYAQNDILNIFIDISKKSETIDQSFYQIGQGVNEKVDTFISSNNKILFTEKENIINAVFKEKSYNYVKYDYFLYYSFKENIKDTTVLQSDALTEFSKERKLKRRYPSIIMPRGIGTCHYAGLINGNALSNSYVELYVSDEKEEKKLNIWLFCNSSIFFLYREISGRKNLGGGLLKSEASDLKLFPLYFPITDSITIKAILKDMGNPCNLQERLNSEVQQRIDSIVFAYFNISEKANIVLSELKHLFEFRCNKAKS